MKHIIPATMVVALMLGSGLGRAGAAQGDATVRHLQRGAVQVDELANKSPAKLQAALHTISSETGMPHDQIVAQHAAHPKATVGQLLFVNAVGAETKKDPESLLKELESGKTWRAIARENNVPLDKLSVHYDNVIKSLQTDK